MAYEKIGFKKGDVLKAEHLNHMEDTLSTLLWEPTNTISINDIQMNLEKIFLKPQDYCIVDLDKISFGTVYFSRKKENGSLIFSGENSVGSFTILTINVDGTYEYSILPSSKIINIDDFISSYNTFFHFVISNIELSNFLTYQIINSNLDLAGLYVFYGFDEDLHPQFKSILHNSVIKISESSFGGLVIEPVFWRSDDYILFLDNITAETVEQSLHMLNIGRTINLIDINMPFIKMPLIFMDTKMWFSTTVITNNELEEPMAVQLFIAITLEGTIEFYLKDPITNKLILQNLEDINL